MPLSVSRFHGITLSLNLLGFLQVSRHLPLREREQSAPALPRGAAGGAAPQLLRGALGGRPRRLRVPGGLHRAAPPPPRPGGCGTLRVAAHFIRFLRPAHFHCQERDALPLAAALLYELPVNGLLPKRPFLLGDEKSLPSGSTFDLVYDSAVFLHMPDEAVWRSLDALSGRLRDPSGRLFVSHNIKFCTPLRSGCEARLRKAGLQLGRRTHDSLLFNDFEVWFEFKRAPRI